ncbi:MAG: UDP-N-acetylglucosamine 1-carboxyvinyltransferase [Candidatus Magasanikbacteria bacterium]|jgi:UDP-N-acetylglucosamine 1-carboxyvinyltransferase|nr:UDP-N-acetylglucosamine 1-carboxyvinyltransferase [Candidatus Magasanikbacteria bacterium]MBT4071349.1 UDP-N-acetylglucosamine 1-carboxyvinyltransferase [Candidatus Magasanikbacteria bacterium]
MAKFIINGGKKLSGKIFVSPAKNAAMGILCASVMVRGKITLHNMPQIQEVDRMLELFASIGVSHRWQANNILEIDSSKQLRLANMDEAAAQKVRSSLMLLGALSTQVKKYKLYKSGGCKLGERTVRPHLYALNKFGVSVESKQRYYEVKNKNITSVPDLVMYESGDTPTENAIMAAVLASGKTVIKFASSNYMVQDLCYFLQAAGAKITGIGTTTLTITGVKKLKSVEYHIMPDPIVAMTWLSLGITTKSAITVKECPLDFLELELEKLAVMGQKFELKKKRKSASGNFTVVDIVLTPSALTALPDKIYGRPFPGLNIDNLPFFIPILTQAKGRTLVHDWVYENRAIYYLELQKLGAKIFLVDPHRVFVEGKTTLCPNELMCPSAIRPAMAVLIAMIAAKGESVLRNCYTIERGYEHVVEYLQAVGVDIQRIES